MGGAPVLWIHSNPTTMKMSLNETPLLEARSTVSLTSPEVVGSMALSRPACRHWCLSGGPPESPSPAFQTWI